MTKESKDQLTRWGAILGIVLTLLSIAAVARAVGDDRYVTQTDYKADKAVIGGKLDRLLDAVCDGQQQMKRACQ